MDKAVSKAVTENGSNSANLIKEHSTKDGIEIRTFEDVKSFAEYLAQNSSLVSQFSEKDENGNVTVNVTDIVACLMSGMEMGLKPLESLQFGKQLNRLAVIKTRKGKAMGLDPINSLQNIYIWESGGKEIIYTGINVVNKCLVDAGVSFNIIEDGNNISYYYKLILNGKVGEEIDFDERDEFLNNKYTVINDGKSPAKLKADIEAGKITIQRFSTRRAKVELIRGKSKVCIPYTLKEAIEAGYYPGINSFGEEVKGKDNWKNHPAALLRKMSIMYGARIIAADKLNGVYETDEIGATKIYTDSEIHAKYGTTIIETDSEVVQDIE